MYAVYHKKNIFTMLSCKNSSCLIHLAWCKSQRPNFSAKFSTFFTVVSFSTDYEQLQEKRLSCHSVNLSCVLLLTGAQEQHWQEINTANISFLPWFRSEFGKLVLQKEQFFSIFCKEKQNPICIHAQYIHTAVVMKVTAG